MGDNESLLSRKEKHWTFSFKSIELLFQEHFTLKKVSLKRHFALNNIKESHFKYSNQLYSVDFSHIR